jgi:cbb3-type cytochrome oxidase cytochrome c subunit
VGPDGPAALAVPDLGTLSTDAAVIAQGETVFAAKGCNACHAWGSKLVGPDLTGVTDRRTVLWVERMIRHPDVMTKEDPVAKGLLRTHMVQMPNQGVSDEDLPALVAFLNSKK